jgi:hypothetical protein
MVDATPDDHRVSDSKNQVGPHIKITLLWPIPQKKLHISLITGNLVKEEYDELIPRYYTL